MNHLVIPHFFFLKQHSRKTSKQTKKPNKPPLKTNFNKGRGCILNTWNTKKYPPLEFLLHTYA